MPATAGNDMEPRDNFNKQMGMIGVELLKRAALCAATVGLIAGMAAAIFYRAG